MRDHGRGDLIKFYVLKFVRFDREFKSAHESWTSEPVNLFRFLRDGK